MLQPGGELDLAQEAVGPERGGELGVEDLEGDGAVVLEVPGQEHRGHPPAPELPLERIARAQAFLELRRAGRSLPGRCGRCEGLDHYSRANVGAAEGGCCSNPAT